MLDSKIVYFDETYKKRYLLEVLKDFKVNKEYVCDKLPTENVHTGSLN